MYFREAHHFGRPHFHARYAEFEATFDIEALEPIAGWLPRRTERLVLRWARLHQEELRLNWEMLRSTGRDAPDRSSAVKLYPEHMEIAPRAVEVEATEGYRVRVRFEDGLAAEIDFSDMVAETGHYTLPLRDPDYFRRVDIYPGGHGIFWPNEADVCPDRLYELAQETTGANAPMR